MCMVLLHPCGGCRIATPSCSPSKVQAGPRCWVTSACRVYGCGCCGFPSQRCPSPPPLCCALLLHGVSVLPCHAVVDGAMFPCLQALIDEQHYLYQFGSHLARRVKGLVDYVLYLNDIASTGPFFPSSTETRSWPWLWRLDLSLPPSSACGALGLNRSWPGRSCCGSGSPSMSCGKVV